MTYAIIENGLCVNIIVAQPAIAAKLGAAELPDGYGIGDEYAGGVWTKTPQPEPMVLPGTDGEPDLAALKRQIDELQATVNALLEGR